ncbi:MAG: Maf family protein [Bacteroidia bacterium]|nr:Maf family protein [Bacteroidia bacterium]
MNQITMYPIILGSKSPRRSELLRLAEIPFEVAIREIDESYPLDLEPELVPEWIAQQKANQFWDLAAERKILTCDTVVILEQEILGKPANESEAFQLLNRLCGKQHTVVSGVALLYQDKLVTFREITQVWLAPFSEAEIEYYVKKYRPLDKAGAYGIQEWIGVRGMQRIEGDFYNVMGLPVCRLVQELKRLAWI